ncbi:hypothetical protein [Aminobacterium colombiense]|uniref:Uncharacterized protein n=1 Tax=Aminobacterium colombiense (strain DSM 12261 / ALA-1) TaxID=572547 RepID=D5EFD6_AMICL|nr:hypothetical protein [Aminobacterium colombiense]ADE57268.1 hypothetical protein Amico_1145 [Aminobacterium colombiense DSM 12261]
MSKKKKWLFIFLGLVFLAIFTTAMLPEEKNQERSKQEQTVPLEVASELPKAPTPTREPIITIDPDLFNSMLTERAHKLPYFPKGTIEIEEIKNDVIRMWFYFDEMPTSTNVIEITGKRIVKTAIDILMENEIDPCDPSVFIRTVVAKKEKGVTGKNLVRIFGKAHYDRLTDSIKWEIRK